MRLDYPALKASAPGSMMLLGEYAVLYGKPALVCAVNKRITVTLTPRADKQIEIYSEALGRYTTHLSSLIIEKPFQFILGALAAYQVKLKQGFDIKVESDFSHTIGFGSSAAVTVAMLAALSVAIGMRTSPLDLLRQGVRVIRLVQGVGSGADIAASVYGGMVGYQAQPLSAEKFSVTHPLTAWYTGFKTPTVEAIGIVQNHFQGFPQLFRHLCNSIGQCALDGINLVRKDEWAKLGALFDIQQGMMEALGVSTPSIGEMILEMRQGGVLGAKISGSGLGDCVIGLGAIHHSESSSRNIPVAMTLEGVQCEKI